MLQSILFPKWDVPGADMTQLITVWEKPVQAFEQQSGNGNLEKNLGAIKLVRPSFNEEMLPNAAVREGEGELTVRARARQQVSPTQQHVSAQRESVWKSVRNRVFDFDWYGLRCP